jgi:hypothetical protein
VIIPTNLVIIPTNLEYIPTFSHLRNNFCAFLTYTNQKSTEYLRLIFVIIIGTALFQGEFNR